MDEKLRLLRISKQLPAKEMVAVVQLLYPKYDKTVQSKCENGEAYGVSIRPDALEALYSKFAPELSETRNKPRKERHRLTCRISARLEIEDFEALQQNVQDDGYETMQDWLSEIVREYNQRKAGQI